MLSIKKINYYFNPCSESHAQARQEFNEMWKTRKGACLKIIALSTLAGAATLVIGGFAAFRYLVDSYHITPLDINPGIEQLPNPEEEKKSTTTARRVSNGAIDIILGSTEKSDPEKKSATEEKRESSSKNDETLQVQEEIQIVPLPTPVETKPHQTETENIPTQNTIIAPEKKPEKSLPGKIFSMLGLNILNIVRTQVPNETVIKEPKLEFKDDPKVEIKLTHKVDSVEEALKYVNKERSPLPSIAHWPLKEVVALLEALSTSKEEINSSSLERLCLKQLGLTGTLKSGLSVAFTHTFNPEIFEFNFVREKIREIEITHPLGLKACTPMLKECTNLTTLIIDGRHCTAAPDLEKLLSNCPANVRSLHMVNCELSPSLFNTLKQIAPALTSLTIDHWTGYKDPTKKHTSDAFREECDTFENSFVSFINSCESLKALHLIKVSKTGSTDIWIGYLKQFMKAYGNQLEALTLQGIELLYSEEENLELFTNCQNLKSLNISKQAQRYSNFTTLTADKIMEMCPKIELLTIDIAAEWISSMGSLSKNIKRLEFNGKKNEDSQPFTLLEEITGLRKYGEHAQLTTSKDTLKTLRFDKEDFNIPEKTLKQILECKRLEVIDLLNFVNLDPLWLERFMHQQGPILKELHLASTRLTNESFESIINHGTEQLKILNLANNSITDDALKALVEKFGSTLQELSVFLCIKLKNPLSILCHCTNLSQLILPERSKIDLDDLKTLLSNNPTLTKLCLSTDLTPEILDLIKGYAPQLRYLNVQGCGFEKLPVDTQKSFKEAMPLLALDDQTAPGLWF